MPALKNSANHAWIKLQWLVRRSLLLSNVPFLISLVEKIGLITQFDHFAIFGRSREISYQQPELLLELTIRLFPLCSLIEFASLIYISSLQDTRGVHRIAQGSHKVLQISLRRR